MRTSLTLGANYSYDTNEEGGTQIQDTAGSYYNGTSETSYHRELSLSRWNTGYYTYSASLEIDDNMIWPGGLINNEYLHKQTFVQPDKITYDDFNLYSPFYGYTSETDGYEIFGQNHVLGPINYNSELDTWERTVTREFKNISGFNITITELGIYKGNFLIVRELLPEPIEVEDQCYFKLSFTYTVANPHENREIKMNRLVSRKPSMIANRGDVGNSYTVAPPNKKCRYLCIRQEDSSSDNKTAEDYFNSYGFDCGINWNYEIIAEKKYYDGEQYNYIQYFIISPVEDVEDKNIIFTTYNRTWYYYSTIYFYALDDAITNIELLENT